MANISHTPQFMPEVVLETIFSNLELPDLINCMLVCKNWNQVINYGSVEPWKSMCLSLTTKEMLESKVLSSLESYKLKLRAFYHSWNPSDCSKNFDLMKDGFTLHRNPIANCSDLARGKIGYSSGKHVWEIAYIQPIGTDSLVGVSTQAAQKRCRDYLPLLGINDQGWGWNLKDNTLYHDTTKIGNYPLTIEQKYEVGEKIRLVLDCEKGTVHFEKNNENLGIAFKGLPKTKLYPSISTVYGDTEVTVVYIGKYLERS